MTNTRGRRPVLASTARMQSLGRTLARSVAMLLILYVAFACAASFAIQRGYTNEREERVWHAFIYPLDRIEHLF